MLTNGSVKFSWKCILISLSRKYRKICFNIDLIACGASRANSRVLLTDKNAHDCDISKNASFSPEKLAQLLKLLKQPIVKEGNRLVYENFEDSIHSVIWIINLRK